MLYFGGYIVQINRKLLKGWRKENINVDEIGITVAYIINQGRDRKLEPDQTRHFSTQSNQT